MNLTGQTTISDEKQPNHADWIQLLGFNGRIPIFGVKTDMLIYQEERRNIRQINNSAACSIFTPALQVHILCPYILTDQHLNSCFVLICNSYDSEKVLINTWVK